MPIHWGSLADLDYTRYKGCLSSVFAGFFRQNVKVFCALWIREAGDTIFGGRGSVNLQIANLQIINKK